MARRIASLHDPKVDGIRGKKRVGSADLDYLADLMLRGAISSDEAEALVHNKPVVFRGRTGSARRDYTIREEDNVVRLDGKGETRKGDLTYSVLDDLDGKAVLVDELFVQPGERGKGCGTLLMDYIEGKAASRGFASAMAEVDRHNEDALRFFEARGYMEVGSTNTGDVDRLVLRKPL